MATQSIETSVRAEPTSQQSSKGWLAVGGLLGAVLASSCCIAPLAFVMMGIGGSWMSQLTALEPYKPIFVMVTLLLLGLAFWHVYFKPQPTCEPGGLCAVPTTGRLTKSILWVATVLVALAMTVNYWAPFFY